MKLTGDHNQCRGCGKPFNSTFAFDKHRTGPHGPGRRCMTTQEMTELGMIQNACGWWISGPNWNACYFAEMGEKARRENEAREGAF